MVQITLIFTVQNGFYRKQLIIEMCGCVTYQGDIYNQTSLFILDLLNQNSKVTRLQIVRSLLCLFLCVENQVQVCLRKIKKILRYQLFLISSFKRCSCVYSCPCLSQRYIFKLRINYIVIFDKTTGVVQVINHDALSW